MSHVCDIYADLVRGILNCPTDIKLLLFLVDDEIDLATD